VSSGAHGEEEEAGLAQPARRRPETWTTSRSTRATRTSPPTPGAPASTGWSNTRRFDSPGPEFLRKNN